MLPAALVKLGGVAAQLALTWPGTLVTFTAIVQLVAAAVLGPTVVPVIVMLLLPAVAVIVPPLQPLTIAGAPATCSPAGNVSVKFTTCAGLFAAGLVTVKVSVVKPPAANVFGLNDFVSVGVCTVTVTQLG